MFCCDGSSFVIDVGIIFEMAIQTNSCVQCYDIHTQLNQSHHSKFVLKQIYIMQRSKTFHTFHLVHLVQFHNHMHLKSFMILGQIQKLLPSWPSCWKTLCYMCFGGVAVGVTRLLGMLHSRKKYEKKCQKLKHLYVLEF